jgi:hypothetical protein
MTAAAKATTLAAVAVLSLAAGCGGSGGSAQRHRPHPYPPLPQRSGISKEALGQFFAPTSIWNTPIPQDVQLDPASSRLSAAVAGMAKQGSALNVDRYSVPVYVAGPRQRPVRIVPDVRNPALHAAFARVPLPAGARPAQGTDRHLVVYQPATDTMWEFWKLRREADGWHCGFGGRMVDVSRNPGYFVRETRNGKPLELPYWGASATGLPLVGGLIMPNELRAHRIDHALALGLPRIRAGIRALPAQRSDGHYAGPQSIPEGARFRIDPSLDLSALGLPPPVLTIARAAQRYGMIVRDGSGAVSLYARDPVNLHPDPYPQLLDGLLPYQVLRGFPWDSLRLVRMRLRAYG